MEIEKIKIAIIEDVKEVAKELQYIFNQEPDFLCNQVYYSAEEAIDFINKNPVDVVLTDIGLPQADGITAMKLIHAKCPQIEFRTSEDPAPCSQVLIQT